MASRRIARSMAASRSNRQLSACLAMIASSAATSFAAPSNSLLAKVRVLSAALALFQNFASSLVKSCWLMSHWNSICIANSRDFVRSDTLLALRLSGGGRLRRRSAKLARQLSNFNGGEPRFESLVPALEPGAFDGLLQRVASQHTEHDRQAAIHLRELQSACSLRAHIIVMCRLAAKHTSDGDQGVILPRRGHFFRGQRQFERSRNVHHINIFARRACTLQRIRRRCQQPLSDKTVKAAHYDAKPKTCCAQCTINLPGLHFLRHRQSAPLPIPIFYFLYLIYFLYRPLNCAGLFSKNAFVPSRMSSVAQATPKSVASRNNPSSCAISTPRSIASMVNFTARGPLAIIFFAIASAAGISSAGSWI